MNNSLIEVTPPDILAMDDGISVLILANGTDQTKWLQELKDFINKIFILLNPFQNKKYFLR